MNILIHAATLHGYGSGNVGRNIILELGPAANNHEITALVPKKWEGIVPPPANSVFKYVGSPGVVSKFWIENVLMRTRFSLSDYDMLLSLGDTSLPFCNIPHILLIQQAFITYDLRELDFPMPASFRWKIILMKKYFSLVKPSVDVFTVQSEVMKQKLHENWKIEEDRIVVIPSSIETTGDEYTPEMPTDSDPYVCYIASPGAHKNFAILADMMASLKKRNIPLKLKLTIAPDSIPEFTHKLKHLEVFDTVDFLGGIELKAVMKVLAGSMALVMPSKLEAFPLPYYEGMSVGCPIVGADRGFVRDVMGDAGLFADADKGEAFADQVAQLYESHALRQAQSEKVKRRFSETHRSWSWVAGEYLKNMEMVSRSKDEIIITGR